MRISIFPDDPGYREDVYTYAIFLDGQRRNDVYTADEELRTVLIHRRDWKGDMLMAGNEVAKAVLTGRVQIVRIVDLDPVTGKPRN